MQQTCMQSLVSRKMKRARECGARRGCAKDYMESSFGPTIPCALPLFKLPGDWVRVWGYSGRGAEQKKGEKAHCFSQLYERKVVPLSETCPGISVFVSHFPGVSDLQTDPFPLKKKSAKPQPPPQSLVSQRVSVSTQDVGLSNKLFKKNNARTCRGFQIKYEGKK